MIPGDPRQLGDYWLAGRLGAGGQGVVYEAYDAAGQRVAVKALHAGFSGDGQRDMLAREIEAVARVSSFCTARMLAAEPDAEPPYVVSEYVPGPDLAHAVAAGGPFPPGELHRLAIGIATALVAIHRAGIVHRDLKPGNVLLGPDGPRVIDFGIARIADMTRSTTGVKGTPPYMAPEIFAGGRAGEASDVWAWGAVVLFTALGRAPFAGDTLPQLAHAVRTAEPETGVLGEPLRAVVAAALAKDPADRPSAHEVLFGLVGGDGETGRLLSEGSRVAAGVHPPQPAGPSLAEEAEAAFQRLDPAAREAAPAVLLRMVLPGEGADDTLRRATAAELGDAPEVRQVVTGFTRDGLLVQDGEHVALASAALLRAWPRLRGWVDAERDGLPAHRSLADAARLWDEHGRRSGDLLQGSVLERAVQWAATGRRNLTLNTVERSFLDACAALTRRRTRLRGALTAVLAVLLVVAVGAAVVAVRQSRTVASQRDKAVADRLAVLATSLHRDDPRTSRRLALAALRIKDDDQTRQAELSAMYQWEDDVFALGLEGEGAVATLNPDGRTATLDNSFKVTRWDLRSHERLPATPGALPKGRPVLSPDGRHMAQLLPSATNKSVFDAVRIYDTSTGRPAGAPLTRPGNAFRSLRYSVGGDYLMADAGTGSGYPRTKPYMALWDARDGHLVGEWKQATKSWAVSADDRYAAMVVPGGLRLWDIRTHKQVPTPWLKDVLGESREPVRRLAFGPRGTTLALVAGTHAFAVDVDRGELTASLSGAPRHSDLGRRGLDAPVFSPDGRFLAVGFTLWEIDDHRNGPPLMDRRLSEDDLPADCRFSAGGDILRCATTGDRIVATNVAAYTGRAPVAQDADRIVLSPFGDRAAIVRLDSVAVWDVRARRASAAIPVPGLSTDPVVFSPDGTLLAIPDASPDSGYGVWDARSLRKLAQLDWPGGAGSSAGVNGVAFSPDGRTLAAPLLSDDGPDRLQFWDARTGRRTREALLKEPASGPMFYRADGRAVTLQTGTVDVPSGRVRTRFGQDAVKQLMALSRDGATALAVAPPDDVYLWNVRAGKRKGPALAAVSNQNSTDPIPAAFSPDGRFAAVSDRTGGIHLYDVASGRQFGLDLPGHADGTDGLAFSRDGRTLFSTGSDHTVQALVLDPERIGDRLCAQVGGLTKAEWKRYAPDLPYRSTCS
ncbi:serine/threonine-protein kinase [Actinomadura sp. NTSP31]|uniref:serine/threonine-protein kinase n=1 Tax=Actinomadura sp. NTSP31 TaxID=1735447 RepID=UPI0035BFF3D7